MRRLGVLDPLEAVALVVVARRERLLARHRHRLPREELEDCYSQAAFELLARARRGSELGGPSFASSAHIANALEQRLISRIHDRRRALGGRSPIEAAIAFAVPLAPGREPTRRICTQLIDERADVVRTALLRDELARIARFSRELSADQRLLLASQLASRQTQAEFCAQHGWTREKYRKVGQRARARLTQLLVAAEAVVPVGAPPSDQQAETRL